MKKQIVLGLTVFFAYNSFAQNKKILGDWKEVYTTQIDTTSDGMDKISSDPESYRKGYKELSPEDVLYGSIYPEKESYRLLITILKENETFTMFHDKYDKPVGEQIIYDPKANNYYVKNGPYLYHNLAVEYDEKNQYLLLIDKETGITMYEFSRK